MKKITRKLSWLLVLAMMFSICAVGVYADEPAKDALTIEWKDTAPEDVKEVKLDIYSGETRVNAEDKPLVVKLDEEGKWTVDLEGVTLKDAEGTLYTLAFTKETTETLGASLENFEAKLAMVEGTGLVLSFAKKQSTDTTGGTTTGGTTTDGTATGGTTPDGTTPDGSTPDGTTPDGTTPGGTTTPDGTTPDGTTPDGTTPGGSTPDGTAPDGTTPGGTTTPDGTTPDGTTPDGTTPGGTTPDGTTPGGTTPGGTTPDGTTPDGTTPGGSTPDGTTPDGTTPGGTTAPDGTTPDGTKPDDTTTVTEKVDYTVSVVWEDGNNLLKKRPVSIQVQLYQVIESNNSVNIGDPVTITPDKNGNWSYVFKDLEKNYNGKNADYRFKLVSDLKDTGYTVKSRDFSTGVMKLQNNYKDYSTVDIQIKATWVDNNNKYAKRPASITVYLYQGDTQYKTATIKPDKNGYWGYTFEDLPVYKDGKAVTYTVKPATVTDYVTKSTVATKDGVTTVTITNTYKDIPLTGDSSQLVLWVLVLLAAAYGLGYTVIYKRQNG